MVKKVDKFSPWPLFYPIVMSDEEKVLFRKYLRQTKYYLEYGSGGSTFEVLKYSKAVIYSVESNLKWLEYLRSFFYIKLHEKNRLFLYHADIGEVGSWGHPINNDKKEFFPIYYSGILDKIDSSKVDLIFVDGRFRVACVLNFLTIPDLNENMLFIVHDFWNRDEYHVLLNYLEVIEQEHTLGIFKVKKGIDSIQLRSDLMKFRLDPA